MYEAFREIDDDEDGKIKTLDLRNKIKEIDPCGKSDDLIEIFDRCDIDKDNYVKYEEFLRVILPDFNKIPNWFRDQEYFLLLIHGYIHSILGKSDQLLVPNDIAILLVAFYDKLSP